MADFEDLNYGETLRGLREGMRVFGTRYVLKRKLGRGGMGEVWLAHDTELEEDVALKFLPEIARQDPVAIDDLRRETRKSRRLAHPNIVRVHDFLLDEQYAAISMEFIEGKTLSVLRLEKPNKVFECEDLELIVKQLCGALEYAHRDARIVHRDLKPANVMQTVDGRLKIADFGISASITDTVSRASVHASSSGTPVYMSPQQLMGDKPSESDDIYSLGALLYELLTGKPPFYTGNVIVQVQSKEPPSVAERREELEVSGEPIPDNWNKLVSACLNKSPDERPKKASEVVNFLKKEVQPGLGQAISSDPQVAMISCPQCEEKIPESAKFCNHCGAQMEQLVEEIPVIQKPVSPPPVTLEVTLPQKEAEEVKRQQPAFGTPIKLPTPKQPADAGKTVTQDTKKLINLNPIMGKAGYWILSFLIGLLFGFSVLWRYFPWVIGLLGKAAVVVAFTLYVHSKTKDLRMVIFLNLGISVFYLFAGYAQGYGRGYLILSAGILFLVGILAAVSSEVITSRKQDKPGKKVRLNPSPPHGNRLLKIPTILLWTVNLLVCVFIATTTMSNYGSFAGPYYFGMNLFLVIYALYLEKLSHIALAVIFFSVPFVASIFIRQGYLKGDDSLVFPVVAAIAFVLGSGASFLKQYVQKKRSTKGWKTDP